MPRKNKVSGFFHDLKKPPVTAQDKTDAAVRLITEAETAKRADLTAALRAARLARDTASDEGNMSAPDEEGPGS